MPFSIRPFRRFPVQCAVTYNAGLFQVQGTVWNISQRVETLGQCATASRPDVSRDHSFAEPRKPRCGGNDRAVGPGSLLIEVVP